MVAYRISNRTITNILPTPVKRQTPVLYSLFQRVGKNRWARIRQTAFPFVTACKVWNDYACAENYSVRPIEFESYEAR